MMKKLEEGGDWGCEWLGLFGFCWGYKEGSFIILFFFFFFFVFNNNVS